MCLGVAEDQDNPLLERRQCLLLHVAAGALGARSGVLPWRQEAQDLAAMLESAQDAERALGWAPGFMTQAEADLRMLAHD
eukprot:7987259-Heterocapsa_arctica.AAC.1